jgi:hypothetical protein
MTKLAIPVAALTQHIAALGKTGSGKTSTAKLAIEQVVADGARVCILDPIKSDWWGLTSSADGKRAGLPFHILGGPRGHVPLHAGAGKAIGELVAGGDLPLSIIDMADFAPGGQAHFFVDFAPALLRKMRGVVYLVIEEAHLFAPKERSGVGKENLSIHWAKTLATAGRSKGIRLILVTQRTQALHNALLGSCDTLIAHRLTAPADQEPVVKWLKANVDAATREKVAGSLASLKTGTGWICSGEAKLFELVEFPRIKTYDNSATPTGDGDDHAVKTAPVDADKLRSIIGDVVKEAEANDPTVLRNEIRILERRLKAGEATKDQIEEARRRGFDQGFSAATAPIAGKLTGIMKAGEDFIARLRAVVAEIETGARPENPVRRESTTPAARVAASPATRARQIDGRAPSKSNGAGEHLPKGEAAVLAACIQFPDGLRREQLTVLTAYKRSSRDAYIQRLRERGYVEAAGDVVVATDAGRAALPNAEPLPTGVELQDFWRARLPEGERKILDILIDRQGESVARADLDELTGYQRSSRDAYLQRLRAKQLVVEPSRGEVRASESLFV